MGLILLCFIVSYVWMRLSMYLTYSNDVVGYYEHRFENRLEAFKQSYRGNPLKLDGTRTLLFIVLGLAFWALSSLVVVMTNRADIYKDGLIYTSPVTNSLEINYSKNAYDNNIYLVPIVTENGRRELMTLHQDACRIIKSSSETPRAIKLFHSEYQKGYARNFMVFGREEGALMYKARGKSGCNCSEASKVIVIVPSGTSFNLIK